jgi:hypothetical protein
MGGLRLSLAEEYCVHIILLFELWADCSLPLSEYLLDRPWLKHSPSGGTVAIHASASLIYLTSDIAYYEALPPLVLPADRD